MIGYQEIMTAYLDAFSAGNLDGILALFSEEALVHSPTTGAVKARDFYPGLLEKSKGTRFTLKKTFTGNNPNEAAILFDYNKALPDGSTKTFDCIDIFEFNNDNKIKEIRIIFDTKNLG